MAGRRRYPTDLSDAEWELVRPLVPPVRPGGRPALHQRREVVDALAYWLRAGCAWRLLPHDLLLVTWNPNAEGPVGRRPSSPARIST